MSQAEDNFDRQPPIRPTQVKTWLTVADMSALGRDLMQIAAEIENSDDEPLDEHGLELELIRRRGGFSANGEQ